MNQVKRIGVLVVMGVFVAFAGTNNVLAESPIVTQMATTEIQQANAQASVAVAINPITGTVDLESAPMQCALSRQAKVDERTNLCLKQAPDEAIRASGVANPTRCMHESSERYNACMVNCGITPMPRARHLGRPTLPERRGPHTQATAANVVGGAP